MKQLRGSVRSVPLTVQVKEFIKTTQPESDQNSISVFLTFIHDKFHLSVTSASLCYSASAQLILHSHRFNKLSLINLIFLNQDLQYLDQVAPEK